MPLSYIRFKRDLSSSRVDRPVSQEQDHVSALLHPLSLSLLFIFETARSFFIPLVFPPSPRVTRLDCLPAPFLLLLLLLLPFFPVSRFNFPSHCPSLSLSSPPSVSTRAIRSSALVFVGPVPVCLSVSLCRIEYHPLNFNPAGIGRRRTREEVTNRTIDFAQPNFK